MDDPVRALRARRAEIASAIEALRHEDEELAITEEVLGRFAGETSSKANFAPPRARQARTNESSAPSPSDRPQSQREFVLDALCAAPNAWLRTDEIIAVAKSRWGVAISAHSLRPLLTVMKKARQIVRRGRTVALRERAGSVAPALARAARIQRHFSRRD